MESFNLYAAQEDGSKVLLAQYFSLSDAQGASTDVSIIYSIEKWDGCFATVLY